ncbi:hypothetical protein [Pseudonocardia sp. McavD-2-B]|uniref:hypothetical protein n=1 Tax=Pseudonocardia sp. McavD-2-B TaxID=2954499 RepID=UPI0020980542|nr:hypothetical protein [Pseudonocardia sp. McavD-2-B]MCO7193954.1 hypothetical protein [Pseudonocardia sp. McavD-2-B]
MELRRVQSLLRRASSKAQDAALALATGARFSEVTDRKVLEFWQGEIERLREEMRQLVAVETTNPQATRSYPTAS